MKTGVADSTRRVADRTFGFKIFPQPPRGVAFNGNTGVLSWNGPQDTSGITHYNIYADSENNLVRQVPAGQLKLQDNLTAARVFIKSYNQFGDLLSAPALLVQQIAPVALVSGTVRIAYP